MNSILPYVGQVLLLAVFIALLTGLWVQNFRLRIGIVVVVIALGMLLPLAGLTPAQWLRSVLGDLSVLTLVILANVLIQRLFNVSLISPTARSKLLMGILLLAAIFYPLALGLGNFDPYRLGYAPVLMSGLLCLASIAAWVKTKYDLAIVLLLPLIAFNLHMLESNNIWDYLLDPVLLAYTSVQGLLAGRDLLKKWKGKLV